MDLINTSNRERESRDNKGCGFVEKIRITESFQMSGFFYQDGKHEEIKRMGWGEVSRAFFPHFVHT